jgi:hypothetical protein
MPESAFVGSLLPDWGHAPKVAGEFEVVARGGEGEGGGAVVGEPDGLAEGEGAESHEGGVDQQREHDTGDVQRLGGDGLALGRKG